MAGAHRARLADTPAGQSMGEQPLRPQCGAASSSKFEAYRGYAVLDEAMLPPCGRAGSRPVGGRRGRFMPRQPVLRGGACVTADDNPCASYRNVFYPGDSCQFSGIRLADDR